MSLLTLPLLFLFKCLSGKVLCFSIGLPAQFSFLPDPMSNPRKRRRILNRKVSEIMQRNMSEEDDLEISESFNFNLRSNLTSRLEPSQPLSAGIPHESADSVDDSDVTTEDQSLYCSDTSDTEKDEASFYKDIKSVMTDITISNSDANKILTTLRKYHPELPCDIRTLRETKSKNASELRDVAPGLYHHFGLEKGLRHILTRLKISGPEILLACNIDGLPVFNSDVKSFWTILCSVKGFNSSTFIVGVYYGEKKPLDCCDFLKDFIEELKFLCLNGLDQFIVRMHHVSCDTPARHFVLNTKCHTAYHGCERCCQIGEFINRRMIFKDSSGIPYTDQMFRNQVIPDHHNGPSPFLDIPGIDLVRDFPLDFMHFACNGLTLKLLQQLRCSNSFFKLSANQFQQLSDLILSLRQDISFHDFARRPRSLKHLGMWKATESRLFLLYLSPVVLPKFCGSDFSNLFVCLCVGMRILAGEEDRDWIDYADSLLKHCVKTIKSLLGNEALTYNTHSLCHIAEDCRRFGKIDSFSCFQYENFLRFVKKSVRSPKKPLQQLINRVNESDQSLGHCTAQDENHSIIFKYQISSSAYPGIQLIEGDTTYGQVNYFDCQLKSHSSDAYVLLKSLHPFEIFGIVHRAANKKIYVIGTKLTIVGNLFHIPLESSRLNIFKIKKVGRGNIEMHDIVSIKCKAMLLQNKYFIPLLHSNSFFDKCDAMESCNMYGPL